MQTFHETSAAHFFDWLTFAESQPKLLPLPVCLVCKFFTRGKMQTRWLKKSLFATTWPKITTSSAGAMLGDNQTIKMAVVTWRDRREGPSSILRLGPSYTIAEFNRRVNLRFCIDHRIAMAKKWRVKESEWILAGVFKKMRCDLFCFLFFFM